MKNILEALLEEFPLTDSIVVLTQNGMHDRLRRAAENLEAKEADIQGGEECTYCRGIGLVNQYDQNMPCPDCNGTGKQPQPSGESNLPTDKELEIMNGTMKRLFSKTPTSLSEEPSGELKTEGEDRKMSFREFIANREDEDNPARWREWAETLPEKLAKENVHGGDCTNMPCTCPLCGLEQLLTEYYCYRFDKPDPYDLRKSQEKEIAHLKQEISEWEKHNSVASKDWNSYTDNLKELVALRDTEIKDLKQQLEQKDKENDQTFSEYQADLDSERKYVKQLQGEIADLKEQLAAKWPSEEENHNAWNDWYKANGGLGTLYAWDACIQWLRTRTTPTKP